MTWAEQTHPLWEFIVLLQICLMTRNRVHGPIDLWRGIRAETEEIVAEYIEKSGKIVVWPPFTSTSRDPRVAERFARHGGVIFKIHIRMEATMIPALGAVDVSEMSKYPSEQEVLLATTIPLRVRKVIKGRPWSVVFLEVETGELCRLHWCIQEVLKWRPCNRGDRQDRPAPSIGPAREGRKWIKEPQVEVEHIEFEEEWSDPNEGPLLDEPDLQVVPDDEFEMGGDQLTTLAVRVQTPLDTTNGGWDPRATGTWA
jgi:hypothetical protein